MKIKFSDVALKEYEWFASNDKKTAQRIMHLLEDIKRDPRKGLGKPEPLKYGYSGVWSRRIDSKNRILYRIVDINTIIVVRCKGHYDEK